MGLVGGEEETLMQAHIRRRLYSRTLRHRTWVWNYI
jgi:hypothetical protein